MTAKDVIRYVVESCHSITRDYVADLSDRDLLVRSVPQSNHIAWTLGHLITSAHQMLTQLGHAPPPLPANFAESHTKEAATSDDPAKFFRKTDYLEWMDKMKAATLAAIDATTERDLDRPGPASMRDYAPTVGAVLTLLGTHWLMHAGQFVPIRRKLGKPALY